MDGARSALVAGLLSIVGFISMPARVEAAPKLIVEAAGGAGFSGGRHRYSWTTDLGQVGHAGGTVAGLALGATFTSGAAWRNWALGGELGVLVVDSLRREETSTSIVHASAVVRFQEEKRPGLGAALALGYATALMPKGVIQLDGGSGYTITESRTESKQGPRVSMGFDFLTRRGAGFATTVSYAHLTSGDASYQPLTVVLQLMFSSW